MTALDEPGAANEWQQPFIAAVAASYGRVTGGDLAAESGLAPGIAGLGRAIWEGDFALLCHDTNAILTYANRFALALWEMDWQAMVRTPSAETAPAQDRAARAALMADVARRGFIRDYSGRRVSRGGRLFCIEKATVWTLRDDAVFGTGAFFKSVSRL